MATLRSSFYTNRAHSVPNAQLRVFAQNVLHSFLAQYFWMWVTLANFTIDRKLNEQINIKIDFLLGLLSFVLSFDVNLKPISWNTVIKLLAPQDALEVILTHSLNVSTDLTDVTPTQLDSEDDECDCSAGSCLDPTDIPARTKTATIQITVSAKRNLAAVANLASNILSQAGGLNFIALISYLLYCTRFVLSSCFIARSLQTTFMTAVCIIDLLCYWFINQ